MADIIVSNCNDALHLNYEASGEEGLVESGGEGKVKGGIEEEEVVGIGARDEGRGVDELDSSDAVDAEAAEGGDLLGCTGEK